MRPKNIDFLNLSLVLVLLVLLALRAQGDKKQKFSKLQTEFSFSDLVVSGRYQSGSGQQTTIENDKSLQDLLQPRSNFDDRTAEFGNMR